MGLWRVRLGSQRAQSPWFPPPSAEAQRSIRWGEPGYPLGKKGYWIGLEGTDQNTRKFEGYGIHGTIEPDSIGKAESRGCIRLTNEDVAEVYDLLGVGSEVVIRP